MDVTWRKKLRYFRIFESKPDQVKPVFIFLSLFSPLSFLAQFEFGPSNYFFADQYGINKIDSLFQGETTYNFVWLPTYPEVHNSKDILSQRTGTLLSGVSVELTEVGDSLLIYQEGYNLLGTSWEREIHYHGEMRISNQRIDVGYTSDIPVTDVFGEPLTFMDSAGIEQYVYPTEFALVPHGIWYCRLDSLLFEMGEYEMGKRIGTWRVYSKKLQTGMNKLVIGEKKYVNGILIDEVLFDQKDKLLHSAEFILILEGQWYNTGWSTSDMWRCRQGAECIYIFNRSSEKFRSAGNYGLDKLTLKQDGTFDKIVGRSCGTGPNYNESDRRKEWFIDNESDLILDGGRYHLEFLSVEIMVLSFFAE